MAYVLLIDDDLDTIQAIQPVLAREGYQVEHALPGPLALRKALLEEPDLVILGIWPHDREWQFFRRLVSVLDSPLFLLLSNAVELDRVKGLDLGADDCMVKPASLVELVARVRVLLRRDNSGVSWRKRSYFVDGEAVDLSPIEYKLLSYFLDHPGRILTHQSLLTQVWGWEYADETGYLKVHIHNLRKKICPDPATPRYVVTERGLGYRFEMPGLP